MISVNLLPAARKKARSGGPSLKMGDFGSDFSDFSSRIRNPWVITAVAGVLLGVLAIAGMWVYQSRRAATLAEQERKAVQDSTRYASVLAERRQVEAQRDSVRRQIAVISAIDGTRLIWPHILDEISRVLPPYVWLRSLNQTSPISSEPPEVQAGISKPAPKKAEPGATAPAADSVLTFQLVGNTVDIQALTRFMKSLEASPFFKNVTLVRSDVLMQQGKEATEFRLDLQYEKPDPKILRTVPYTVSVR